MLAYVADKEANNEQGKLKAEISLWTSCEVEERVIFGCELQSC